MSKVKNIETAARYLLVCAIFATPCLPAFAQAAAPTAYNLQQSGPVPDLSQSSAPLFSQPNYQGDLRQHCFFAGDYRDPIQTGVGYNEQALQYRKDPIWQNVPDLHTPTPVSTGLIGDNIDVEIQNSVPGLVGAAIVQGGAGTLGIMDGNGSTAIDTSAGNAGVGGTVTTTSVNGAVAPGTSF